MDYVKACDVLPPHLLEEIQSHVEGCVLYIPQKAGKRKAWGEKSGAKKELRQRNEALRKAFRSGAAVEDLADQYCLAVDTVRKIIYAR